MWNYKTHLSWFQIGTSQLALTISSRQECHLKEIKLCVTRINSPSPPRVLLKAYLPNTSVSTLFSHCNNNLIRPWGLHGRTREMLTGWGARRLRDPSPCLSRASNTQLMTGQDLSPKAVLNSQQPQGRGIGLGENSLALLVFYHISTCRTATVLSLGLMHSPVHFGCSTFKYWPPAEWCQCWMLYSQIG